MDLHAIRTKIIDSGPHDWNVVVCWGYGSGPSYLEQWSYWTAGDDDEVHGLHPQSHSIRAAYVHDVSLGIATGLDSGSRRDRDEPPPWASVFADQSVSYFHADVLWNGMLIDRELMVSVDGGRASMPAPHNATVEDGSSIGGMRLVGHWVSRWEYEFARVVHGLEPGGDFEEYFQRLGWEVRD